MQNFSWQDTQIIAEELYDLYPDINPQYIRFTDLHQKICTLKGFEGEANKSNERILEAVQMAWIEEAS